MAELEPTVAETIRPIRKNCKAAQLNEVKIVFKLI